MFVLRILFIIQIRSTLFRNKHIEQLNNSDLQ
jgi:hypothetical protein